MRCTLSGRCASSLAANSEDTTPSHSRHISDKASGRFLLRHSAPTSTRERAWVAMTARRRCTSDNLRAWRTLPPTLRAKLLQSVIVLIRDHKSGVSPSDLTGCCLALSTTSRCMKRSDALVTTLACLQKTGGHKGSGARPIGQYTRGTSSAHDLTGGDRWPDCFYGDFKFRFMRRG